MTGQQLYLAIGIPAVLFSLNFIGVLAAAFWQAKRFDDLKHLLKSEIGRVESTMRSDLSRVEGVLGTKLDALASRVKVIEDEIHSPLVKQ